MFQQGCKQTPTDHYMQDMTKIQHDNVKNLFSCNSNFGAHRFNITSEPITIDDNFPDPQP